MRIRIAGLLSITALQGKVFAWSRDLQRPISRNNEIMSLRANKRSNKARSLVVPPLRGGSSSDMPPVIFNNAPFFLSQKIFVGANLAGYLLSLVSSSHYHVDLLGTGAFAAAALPSLLNPTAPTRVHWSAAAVITWSVKLASFLLFRVIEKGGHDARLDEIMANPVWSAGFWTFSVLWGVLCSLPHTLGTTSSSPGNLLALRSGAAVFGIGFLTETLADYQKWTFKQSHPGEFCSAGLWSVSQHPNWFGNLLVWTGIFIMNAPSLIEPVSPKAGVWKRIWSYRRVGLALLSPMFMWYLFSGQATGRILPDGYEQTLKRYGYGEDLVYTNYVDNTPLIIPNPFKLFSPPKA